MRRFLKDNGLGLVTFSLFFITLIGLTFVGHRTYNAEQEEHGEKTVTLGQFLKTGYYLESVFENWESEFLQMGIYVFLTAFLVQRGSAESKKPTDELEGEKEASEEDPELHRNDPDAPWPVRYGGVVSAIYENSLGLAFLLLFLMSFAGHAAWGLGAYNSDQLAHGQPAVSIFGYLSSSQFWFESLQNWQSEFLAVLAIVVLSIFLRQRGSPESKPTHAPLSQTGND
jgi:hypothetical protein